jgi:hypothetical protein
MGSALTDYFAKRLLLLLVTVAVVGGGCGACGLYVVEHVKVHLDVQRK